MQPGAWCWFFVLFCFVFFFHFLLRVLVFIVDNEEKFDFSGLRLDWFRLQVRLSSGGGLCSDSSSESLHHF